jgi:hypothetical protein
MSETTDEISVWTDGYEGRILQWSDERWCAFDIANFRHSFSPPQALSPRDMSALRARYRIPDELLSDDQIAITNPKVLTLLSGDAL